LNAAVRIREHLINSEFLPDVFRPINPNKYAAANKTMEENLRKAKRQAVGYADGVKNPSHYEYLAEAVYKNVESE
jgi:hypothetical protein